ncbi:hypothetical protein BGY98DRAFT_940750, partial [Russula aff. rugulosa BPL654]
RDFGKYGHGTCPLGDKAKAYPIQASTRSSFHSNTWSQPVQPMFSKVTPAHLASFHHSESPAPTNQTEQAIIIHKEIFLAFSDIADRLDKISETSMSLLQFKKTIATLAKHIRKAAKIAPETQKILEATTIAKELKGQISKVAVASNKITNNAAPYQDAFLEGTCRNMVDKRVLIDIDHKAKQIMLIIKDYNTALLNSEKLASKVTPVHVATL